MTSINSSFSKTGISLRLIVTPASYNGINHLDELLLLQVKYLKVWVKTHFHKNFTITLSCLYRVRRLKQIERLTGAPQKISVRSTSSRCLMTMRGVSCHIEFTRRSTWTPTPLFNSTPPTRKNSRWVALSGHPLNSSLIQLSQLFVMACLYLSFSTLMLIFIIFLCLLNLVPLPSSWATWSSSFSIPFLFLAIKTSTQSSKRNLQGKGNLCINLVYFLIFQWGTTFSNMIPFISSNLCFFPFPPVLDLSHLSVADLRQFLQLEVKLTVKLIDMIDTLKAKIRARYSKYDEMYGQVYIRDGMYVLISSGKLLEDGSSTLDKCGVKDEDVLQLC